MNNRDVYSQVSFVKTVTSLGACPQFRNSDGKAWPEIAVAGRSNVGKSSLLNTLFGRKQLVKTSATPGKTRALNYFNASDQLLFVDLPGYGYARAAQKEQEQWAQLIDSYLHQREELSLILLLLDLRRDPTTQDRMLIEWCQAMQKPLLVVFTKADKIARTKRERAARMVASKLKLGENYVVTSVKESIGRSQLIGAIAKRT
jgi:GTP-binding protein